MESTKEFTCFIVQSQEIYLKKYLKMHRALKRAKNYGGGDVFFNKTASFAYCYPGIRSI